MSESFYKNYNKNVFEGEECSLTNPELGRARRENSEQKWDYHSRKRIVSSLVYDSEAERRKALWELGRKSNPMLKGSETSEE